MKKIIIILMLAFVLTVINAEDPIVSNVQISQSTDGSKIVTINYDLAYDGTVEVYVDLYLSTDSGNSFSDTKIESNLTGDFGVGVTAGSNTVTWDISSEVEYEADTYRIKLVADEVIPPPVIEGFVHIPAGSFTMGADYAIPTHTVNLSAYYVSAYEVTQSEWIAVMGSNPSWSYAGISDDRPVNQVNWYNSVKYCNKLSISENLTPVYSVDTDTNPDNWGDEFTPVQDLTANGYRLLTEAEWEYAARGATSDPDYLYSGSNTVGDVAWYNENNGSWGTDTYGCKPVGTKQSNALDIYDMSGNLSEWCWDWYDGYSGSEQTNPSGPQSGASRLYRGGNWNNSSIHCRVTIRSYGYPTDSRNYVGLRLSRTAN